MMDCQLNPTPPPSPPKLLTGPGWCGASFVAPTGGIKDRCSGGSFRPAADEKSLLGLPGKKFPVPPSMRRRREEPSVRRREGKRPLWDSECEADKYKCSFLQMFLAHGLNINT